jgi:hypothetical protein
MGKWFPLLDSTDKSRAGNVSTTGFIFSKRRGNIDYIVTLEDNKYPATGVINEAELKSLGRGDGLIELTKEGSEYLLDYIPKPLAKQDEDEEKRNPYARHSLTTLLVEQGYDGNSPLITGSTIPQLRLMLEEAYQYGVPDRFRAPPPPPPAQPSAAAVFGESKSQIDNRAAQDAENNKFFTSIGWKKGGRRHKTKKSKRRARKTRRRHK